MKSAIFAPCLVFGLVACAGHGDITLAEERVNVLADESSRGASFPVLGPLPTRQQVVGAGISEQTATELRGAAGELTGLRRMASNPRPSLSTAETVAELRELVARLEGGSDAVRPPVDVGALGFPTPPPLD